MKPALVAVFVFLFAVQPLLAEAPPAAKGEWTGYITDTECGARGAVKDHTVACVQKCMRKGSKAQILNDADKKIYDLDSFDKVKPWMGGKVTVKGSLSADQKTISVESAERAH